MGWTGTFIPSKRRSDILADWRKYLSRKHVFAEIKSDIGNGYSVIDYSFAKDSTWSYGSCHYAVYLAIKSPKGEVGAAVALYSLRKAGYEYDICYRIDPESFDPIDKNCPKRILDKLTPTDNEWANEWRQECHKNLAR